MPLIPGRAFVGLSHWILVALLCVLMAMGSRADAQDIIVRAELNKPVITLDESVSLTIVAQGIDAELDPSSLNENFDVVSRSSSREISATIGSNGQLRNVSVVRWVLELLPRGQGVFTVPAVKVGDYETQLLTLTVNEIPTGANREIFLETIVDTTEPWVQSQVLMTLKVFQAIDIIDGGLDAPAGEHLTVQRIGDDTQSIEQRDGREYRVTERRFAIFAQKSGKLIIDPVTLQVSVPADPKRVRGFFSPTRKLTRRSDPIELEVQARPSAGASWWLPAKALTIQGNWQSDPDGAQVDQPLTRTLVVTAQGVLQSQLPEISIPAVEGLSLYAEDPQLAMGGDESGLVAEQRINWALIPQRSGSLSLPEVVVEWFNTNTGRNETARLPAQTINVAPAGASSNDTSGETSSETSGNNSRSTPSGNSANSTANGLSSEQMAGSSDEELETTSMSPLSDSNSANDQQAFTPQGQAQLQTLVQRIDSLQASLQRWRALAVFTAFTLLVVLVLWWFKRSSTKKAITAQGSVSTVQNRLMPLKDIRLACKQGDLLQIKRALFEWSANQWPEDPPTTLDSLCSRIPEGAARDKLNAMRLALYSKDGYTATMQELAGQLCELPDDLVAATKDINQGQNTSGDSATRDGYSRLPSL